jgi:uncharacterized membrane protein YhaH (DUF805 family)
MSNPQQPNPYSSDPQRPSPYSPEQHTSPYSPQPTYPNAQYQPPQYPNRAGYQSEPPLWAPWYDAPFKAAVRRVFKKYATFTGRASRAEYWWWAMVSVVVWTVLNIITTLGSLSAPSAANGYTYTSPTPGPLTVIGSILLVVWGLAIAVPTLALTVRRLHDVNMSGWVVLLGLIPFVGNIIVLVFTLLRSNPAGQRFDRPTAPVPAYNA